MKTPATLINIDMCWPRKKMNTKIYQATIRKRLTEMVLAAAVVVREAVHKAGAMFELLWRTIVH